MLSFFICPSKVNHCAIVFPMLFYEKMSQLDAFWSSGLSGCMTKRQNQGWGWSFG
jgi:hypothetical protein